MMEVRRPQERPRAWPHGERGGGRPREREAIAARRMRHALYGTPAGAGARGGAPAARAGYGGTPARHAGSRGAAWPQEGDHKK